MAAISVSQAFGSQDSTSCKKWENRNLCASVMMASSIDIAHELNMATLNKEMLNSHLNYSISTERGS